MVKLIVTPPLFSHFSVEDAERMALGIDRVLIWYVEEKLVDKQLFLSALTLKAPAFAKLNTAAELIEGVIVSTEFP